MRSRAQPYVALAILTALNFLNFIDRSILFQVQPLIQREFGVSSAQIGLLTTAFMLCFMIAAPLLGFLEDRYPRRPLIVAGAIVWSVATLLTAVTGEFRTLLIRHAIVGVGEACMVAAPGYIADLFPREKRGRMLAFFFMGGPAGTALGFLTGGLLGHLYGWRAPFYVVSGPGVLMALLLLVTREPERGAQDAVADNAERRTVRALLRNRAYLTCTLAIAMLLFAVGGAQVWMPDFLQSVRGMSMLGSAVFVAAIAVFNGVVAILAGGWLADRARRRRPDGDYLVSARALAIAVPLTLAAIYVPRPGMFPAIFTAYFLMLLSYSPIATAVVQSVAPGVRSIAVALHMVAVHLLGDAISPPLIGYVADRTGSLQLGLTAVALALGFGSFVLFYGRRFAPRTQVADTHRAAALGQ